MTESGLTIEADALHTVVTQETGDLGVLLALLLDRQLCLIALACVLTAAAVLAALALEAARNESGVDPRKIRVSSCGMGLYPAFVRYAICPRG